jgi:hypothetical protein
MAFTIMKFDLYCLYERGKSKDISEQTKVLGKSFGGLEKLITGGEVLPCAAQRTTGICGCSRF